MILTNLKEVPYQLKYAKGRSSSTEAASKEETVSTNLSSTSSGCTPSEGSKEDRIDDTDSSGSGRKITLAQETEIRKQAQALGVGREAPPQNADVAQILRGLLQSAREGMQGSDSLQLRPISTTLHMGEEEQQDSQNKEEGGGDEVQVVATAPAAIDLSQQRADEEWMRIRNHPNLQAEVQSLIQATPFVAGAGRSTSTGPPGRPCRGHTSQYPGRRPWSPCETPEW